MAEKILFLGYATGVFSSRKLQQQCQENLAFLHLTGGQRPKFTETRLGEPSVNLGFGIKRTSKNFFPDASDSQKTKCSYECVRMEAYAS